MNLTLSTRNFVQPEVYKDDLAKRIFPMRFRRIGNPYAFLNEVGITPILEFMYKGNLLIDVAEALNVSLTILSTWVEEEGHGPAVEEAEQLSAEGYLAEGHRKLRESTTTFELSKAREMVKQAQFMASKKNKRTYGTSDTQQQGAGVSYVFNIGGDVSAPTLKAVEAIVAHTQQDNDTPLVLDTMAQIESDTPIGAIDFAVTKRYPLPDRPLVNMTHLENTPDEPDIGPFYDEDEP